jgi:hypothetical protein
MDIVTENDGSVSAFLGRLLVTWLTASLLFLFGFDIHNTNK